MSQYSGSKTIGSRLLKGKTMSSKLNIRVSCAALALASLALSGCNYDPTPNYSMYDPRLADYQDRHPIVLSEEEDTLELYIGSGSHSLTMGDRSALNNFVRRYQEAGESGLTVLVPSGVANESAAHAVLSDVHKVISEAGVNPRHVLVEPYRLPDPMANAPIRVVYSRVQAVTNPCGHWPDDVSGDFENRDNWNFGCATQANIAAMLADPRDAVRTRGLGPASAARRATVLENYRTGQATAAAASDAEASVADVEQ